MVIAAAMGVLTGLNGFYVSTSRVLLTMGRDWMLPKQFASTSTKFGTPVVGIVFTLVICLVTPWFGRAALSWVVDMTSVGITVAYFYTCYCSYKIDRTGHVDGMSEQLRSNRVQVVVGFAGCVLACGFVLLLLVPTAPGALGAESLTALLVWIATGGVFFVVRRKAFLTVREEAIHRALFQ